MQVSEKAATLELTFNRTRVALKGNTMLVLTRRLDQTITIGDAVEVTVIEVRGDQVRLGIKAPRDVAVDRKEIWLEKQSFQKTRQKSEA